MKTLAHGYKTDEEFNIYDELFNMLFPDEDVEKHECTQCNGTGEGTSDRGSCRSCRGSGVIRE